MIKTTKRLPTLAEYMSDGDLSNYLSGGYALVRINGGCELCNIVNILISNPVAEECSAIVVPFKPANRPADRCVWDSEDAITVKVGDIIYQPRLESTYVGQCGNPENQYLAYGSVVGIRAQRSKLVLVESVSFHVAGIGYISSNSSAHFSYLKDLLLRNLNNTLLKELVDTFNVTHKLGVTLLKKGV